MALDHGGEGVRVNAVSPSLTHTEMTEGMTGDEDLMARFADRIPMGRGGDPAEVADVIAFLAGPDARGVGEVRDVVGAAPGQGDAGTAVPVVVDHPRPGRGGGLGLQPHLRAGRAQAREVLQDLGVAQGGDDVAAASQDRLAGGRVGRRVPDAVVEGAAEDAVVGAGVDVGASAGVLLVAHRHRQAGVGDTHDPSPHRGHRGVTDQGARAHPGAVHDEVGVPPGLVERRDAAAFQDDSEAPGLGGQPGQVHRHLDQRHRETQAVGVAGRQLAGPGRADLADGVGPPLRLRLGPVEGQRLPHHDAGDAVGGLSRQLGEGATSTPPPARRPAPAPTSPAPAAGPHSSGPRSRRRPPPPVGCLPCRRSSQPPAPDRHPDVDARPPAGRTLGPVTAPLLTGPALARRAALVLAVPLQAALGARLLDDADPAAGVAFTVDGSPTAARAVRTPVRWPSGWRWPRCSRSCRTSPRPSTRCRSPPRSRCRRRPRGAGGRVPRNARPAHRPLRVHRGDGRLRRRRGRPGPGREGRRRPSAGVGGVEERQLQVDRAHEQRRDPLPVGGVEPVGGAVELVAQERDPLLELDAAVQLDPLTADPVVGGGGARPGRPVQVDEPDGRGGPLRLGVPVQLTERALEVVVLRARDQPQLTGQPDPRAGPVGRRDGGAEQREERVDELQVLLQVVPQHAAVQGAGPQLVDEPVPDRRVPGRGRRLAQLRAESHAAQARRSPGRGPGCDNGRRPGDHCATHRPSPAVAPRRGGAMTETVNRPEAGGELKAGLRDRHVTMISIAGVIGAGLFIGSGTAISTAGPAVLLAYLFAGALVVLVMRMLGEMAAAQPDSGSFSTYADRAIGPWAGFTVGWLYWWFWVLVIPVEATAAAVILNSWLPGVPQWGWALAVTVLLTVTNLFSVANYGEFEFWFALLKVVAIIAFIVFGALAVLGLLPGFVGDDSSVSGLSRLVSEGGFLPNGPGAVIAAVLVTMFSFMGTEIVTIAAAESGDPARADRQGHPLGDLADLGVLPGLHPAGRRDRAVERPAAAGERLLPGRAGGAGRPVREADRRRRGARRRRQLPELGAVHGVADAVLPRSPRAGPGPGQPDHRAGRAAVRGARVDAGRVRRGDRELRLPGGGLRRAARDLRRDRTAGLPGHRGVPAADAPGAGARRRRDAGADVGLPGAHLGGDRRDPGGARLHGHPRGLALRAGHDRAHRGRRRGRRRAAHPASRAGRRAVTPRRSPTVITREGVGR
ncbi:hypothetical protein L7F22_060427 [Adiantum nelumboides]|nr:hypothetical protein [Adiantum nelumboides]